MEQEKHFAMTFKGTSVADLKQNNTGVPQPGTYDITYPYSIPGFKIKPDTKKVKKLMINRNIVLAHKLIIL